MALRWLGSWVAETSPASLRADFNAALLAAVLVLPQSIAFAALCGVPPAWGLAGAVVPTIIAALAGSSRHVLSGPTNALSLALAASLAPLASVGSPEYLRLALAVVLMTGLIVVAVALLRLGTLAHFIAPAVMLGFTTGAAALIAWHSLGDAGLWPAVHPAAVAVALFTLAIGLLLRRLWRRAPTLLLALAAGTLLGVILERFFDTHTLRLGVIPHTLPTWQLPTISLSDVQSLGSIALALALVALGQGVAIAKLAASRTGQALDINREVLGLGLANVAGAFFSCLPTCGSISRTLPNIEAGARSPLSAVFAAGLLLLLVALGAPLLAIVPMAAVAGVLLMVAWTLVDGAAWRELLALDKSEAAVAAGTLAATVLLPLQVAVLAGVAASLVVYLYRTAHPALRNMGFATPPDHLQGPSAPALRPFVVLRSGAPECPQLKLLRMEGPVWFGAAAHVADALQALRDAPQPARHLLVMGKSMNFIDVAGGHLWEQERRRRRQQGGDLYFHRPRPEVMQLWLRSGFVERLGADHLFADKRSAIAAIVPRLDGSICAACPYRIFEECARQPGGTA